MKALYNSSLLSPVNSVYTLELMMRATFKQGIVAGLPTGVDVAHKFGEAGTPQSGSCMKRAWCTRWATRT